MARRLFTAVGLALAMSLIACSSPTSPGTCVNGHDGFGRGPVSYLTATCTLLGSAVQCQSMMEETGYCAGPSVDVTATAHWVSTDSSVAISTGGGHFQLQAPGGTVIYSESGSLFSQGAFGYLVAPAGGFQQVVVVDVTVWQTTTGGFLPLATVEFSSATGTQTCQLGSGAPYTPCRFWTDFSPAVVRASAPGFTTVQQSMTPTSSGGLSAPIGVLLRLMPSP